MCGMRVLPGLAAPLVALLVLAPFASASTFETWTDGLYDAESDDSIQAVKTAEGVVECAPPVLVRYVPIVAALATSGDDPVAPAAGPPSPPGRAPPVS